MPYLIMGAFLSDHWSIANYKLLRIKAFLPILDWIVINALGLNEMDVLLVGIKEMDVLLVLILAI